VATDDATLTGEASRIADGASRAELETINHSIGDEV